MKRLKVLSKLAHALRVGKNVWRTPTGRILMFDFNGEEIDLGTSKAEGFNRIMEMAR